MTDLDDGLDLRFREASSDGIGALLDNVVVRSLGDGTPGSGSADLVGVPTPGTAVAGLLLLLCGVAAPRHNGRA